MIETAAEYIRMQIGSRRPETAVILGSGLGALGDEITAPVVIPYQNIPGFPQSTVAGHKGCLIAGRLEGRDILCMQGRIHLYEGHNPRDINLIIKVFQSLGIKNLIVTNAAGSLDYDMPPGSIMLIKDHINFSGRNPLIGSNDERYGPRFPDVKRSAYPFLKASISWCSAPTLKLLPKSKLSAFWAPTPSVCPRFPKLSAQHIPASRYSAFPSLPTSEPVCSPAPSRIRKRWHRPPMPHKS